MWTKEQLLPLIGQGDIPAFLLKGWKTQNIINPVQELHEQLKAREVSKCAMLMSVILGVAAIATVISAVFLKFVPAILGAIGLTGLAIGSFLRSRELSAKYDRSTIFEEDISSLRDLVRAGGLEAYPDSPAFPETLGETMKAVDEGLISFATTLLQREAAFHANRTTGWIAARKTFEQMFKTAARFDLVSRQEGWKRFFDEAERRMVEEAVGQAIEELETEAKASG